MKNNKKAFTSVEVIIVMVVLGVVGLIGHSVYSKIQNKATMREERAQKSSYTIVLFNSSGMQLEQYETNDYYGRDGACIHFTDIKTGKEVLTTLPYLLIQK